MSKTTTHNAEKKEMINQSHSQNESIMDQDEAMMFANTETQAFLTTLINSLLRLK